MLLKMNNEMKFVNSIRFEQNQTNSIAIHFIEMIPSGLVFNGI